MILKENTYNGKNLEDLKYSELFELVGRLEIETIQTNFSFRPSKKEVIEYIKRLRNALAYTFNKKGEYINLQGLTNKELRKVLK